MDIISGCPQLVWMILIVNLPIKAKDKKIDLVNSSLLWHFTMQLFKCGFSSNYSGVVLLWAGGARAPPIFGSDIVKVRFGPPPIFLTKRTKSDFGGLGPPNIIIMTTPLCLRLLQVQFLGVSGLVGLDSNIMFLYFYNFPN